MRDLNLPEKIDPEIATKLLTRRSAILRGATVSGVVAAGLRLGTVPAAIAALSRDAFAQGGLPMNVMRILNFALLLEYLEAEFYNTGVGQSGLIPAADRRIFITIQGHENAHVQYLRTTLGSAAIAKPTFDYTAGNGSFNGPYADVFSNYETFKAVAQAFEDTGVRAYKGQAGNLQLFPAILTAALTIHSVEARHAAEVRRLRGNFSEMAPNKGWITGAQTDIPGTAAVYANEDNTIHLGINVTGVTPVGVNAITESFDEPLIGEDVVAIVDPFIV